MHGKRIWLEEIKTLWCGTKHLENTAKAKSQFDSTDNRTNLSIQDQLQQPVGLFKTK